MSCSIDHYLKMWNIKSDKITKAIDDSETFFSDVKSFPTLFINYPHFATRDVHTNYIDCVRWLSENIIISKVISYILI
jgi:hypothetical protein